MDLVLQLDTIDAMVGQEKSYYQLSNRDEEMDPILAERFGPFCMEWRDRMLIFYHKLLNRIGSTTAHETLEIACSYLDRFLAAPGLATEALRNKPLFQLLSTTVLYTAVKMHEVSALTPTLMANISHGVFTDEDVEEMELVLAQTLQWRLNPPTSHSFIRLFLDLIPERQMDRAIAYKLATYQTEWTMRNELLFTERKAVIAYWAFENALDALHIYNEEISAYLCLAVFGDEDMAPGQMESQRLLKRVLKIHFRYILPAIPSPAPSTAKSWFWFGQKSSSPDTLPMSEYDYRIHASSPRSVGGNVA